MHIRENLATKAGATQIGRVTAAPRPLFAPGARRPDLLRLPALAEFGELIV